MKTSVRDLIITGWLVIFATTVGTVAFHPSFEGGGMESVLRLGGLALISTLGGVGLIRYTKLLGRSPTLVRRTALGVFVVSMLPLIPVALQTFSMPWGALIIVSLVYVRWKWALVSSSD
jgi:hypothetical protein